LRGLRLLPCPKVRDKTGFPTPSGKRAVSNGAGAVGGTAACPDGWLARRREWPPHRGPWLRTACAPGSARSIQQHGRDSRRVERSFFMSTGTALAKPYEPAGVPEFLELVRNVRDRTSWFKDDHQWGPWFRGQQKATWDLKPRLYRGMNFSEVQRRRVEDEMREEFIKRAPVLCENLPAVDDRRSEWAWYFMMQHFGAATRLLDWTEGALIALYFAVRPSTRTEDKKKEDAAVWMFDPYQLNEQPDVLGREWILPPSASGVKDDEWARRVQQWLPDRFTDMGGLPEKPVAIEPTHVVRRMSSQHSCFTIHGSDEDALDKLHQEDENGCVVKILVPAAKIHEIRRDLSVCGINEATIFPDLDGLGRSIDARWDIDGRTPRAKGKRAR